MRGRLGSLAHIQFCLPLPLPVLDYLLLPFPPSPHLGTAATLCAQMCPGACAQVWGRSGLDDAPCSILIHSMYQAHPGLEVVIPWGWPTHSGLG